jgi:hypothetical protein
MTRKGMDIVSGWSDLPVAITKDAADHSGPQARVKFHVRKGRHISGKSLLIINGRHDSR